jgi:DNA-3-methyladenine glycosylase II
MPRLSLTAGIAEVAARDPQLAHVIDLVGPIKHFPRSDQGHFATLTRGIVSQQLSGRVAQAILGRVVVAIGGHLTPEAMLAASDEVLRGAGLSRAKVASLHDLSAKILDGTLDLDRPGQSDEELTARLVAVRGIGPWTAQLYLMLELRRLDIWPVEDLGVRQGYGVIWGIDPPPTAKQLVPLGERFHPYRTVVARYCWEAIALFKGGTDPSLR